ncbi:MAG: phosphatase PAP2 family protein [Gammaproteobacteria bacterium]
MARPLLMGVIVVALGLHSVVAAGINPDLVATDVLTAVVPLTGLAVAYFTGDAEGKKEWLRNTGVNLVVTSALRLTFNQTSLGQRPNGGSYGFPSGHEALVMSGAAFLGERYGWKWGIPAYLAAAYVGYVRVHEDKHHVRDVIASGLLSYGVALLTVTPENATHLAPIIGPDVLGLRWERSF